MIESRAGKYGVVAALIVLAMMLATTRPKKSRMVYSAAAANKESFPDFRCTTPVYFLFAAGAIDGATRQVGAAVCLTPPAGSTDDAAWTT